MVDIMEIDGCKAVIRYDPVLGRFRGEFVGLSGGADFYAADIETLREEGRISLRVFLDMCGEEDINPHKEYSGRFDVSIPPELHAEIAARAAAEGKSLNQCVTDMLDEVIQCQQMTI